MDEELITLYDDKNFRSLMNEFKTLYNFEGVTKWELRAQEEIDSIIKVIEAIDIDIESQGKELENEKKAHAQSSFISRIFGKNTKLESTNDLYQRLRENKKNLSEMLSQLEEAIAFTPNSLEEQMNLAEEFRQRKMELVEKQETAAIEKRAKKEVNAEVSNSFGTFYDFKTESGKAQRRQIRYVREALLEPHESLQASIERQLAQNGLDILWAAKFTR